MTTEEALVVPGYITTDGVAHSKEKLAAVASTLSAYSPRSIPCTTEADTWAYRCKCSFQIVQSNEDDGTWQYALRHQGQVIPISTFPIATRRIQRAMKDLQEFLTSDMKQNWTSVTFSSSWSNDQDCVLTMHYGQPLEDDDNWKHEAAVLCEKMQLRQITGRSKKKLLVAREGASLSSLWTRTDPLAILRDTLWLIAPSRDTDKWQVTLDTSKSTNIPVRYEKPEGAFFHPNANTMQEALAWMLNRLEAIASRSNTGLHLLELYSGCGAHTIALASSGLLSSITCVELDARLVEACRVNCQLNQLEEKVKVVSKDAGAYLTSQGLASNIILVDPPKQGLDESVCKVILKACQCEDMLYISCGHQALERDLKRLHGSFEVVDAALTDLFPRTQSSVESLVHLRRRTRA